LLKKVIIPSSLGIAAIAFLAVMFTLPVEMSEEKVPGLIPPVPLMKMVGLEEITRDTPNRSVGDVRSSEANAQDKQPNKEFMKYQSIKNKLDTPIKGFKILSNPDNSRISIMLSSEPISDDITNLEFLWKDEGVLISLYKRTIDQQDDDFTSNPDEDAKVVTINKKFDAVITSQAQQTLGDVTTDSPLTLRMLSDTHQITIKGFISDSEAIKLADYLTTR